MVYLSEQKQGTPHARNAAIGACESPYLGFVDDDCILDPHWVASGLEAIRNKKITYVLGKSLLFNTKNVVARAQYVHYSYWFSVKLKEALPYAPPMKFDTKNVIVRTGALRKYRLLFNDRFACGAVDSSDTDMGFQLDKKNYKGIYMPQMIVRHEESENFYRFLYKSYWRGRLAYRLAKKWNLSDELVCLPHKNWFTYLRSIRYWPDEYTAFMRGNSQSRLIKVIMFLLIKAHDRVYLEGYLRQMSLSDKKSPSVNGS